MKASAPTTTAPKFTTIGGDTPPSDAFVDALADLLLAVGDADLARRRLADGADADGHQKEQDR